MGSCCSKTGSVIIKENMGAAPKGYKMLITENVGKGEISGAIDTDDYTFKNDANTNSPTKLPIIQSPQDLPTQEAESINTYNKQDNSAARSTLIFPSYSGYRNTENFTMSKKTDSPGGAPTALVIPFQATMPSPMLPRRSPSEFIVRKGSPMMTRYSPLTTPILPRKNPPSAFENHTVKNRKGSVESRGFDSDIESDIEEKSTSLEARNNLTSSQSEQDTATAGKSGVAVNTSPNVASKGKDAIKEIVDVSIRADSEDTYRPKQSAHTQVDLKQKKSKTTSNATATDSEPVAKTKKNTILSGAGQKTTSTSAQSQHHVEMVDVCLGTDDTNFYRSTQTTMVQVDLSKKKGKTTSMATGTDRELAAEAKKHTQHMIPTKSNASTGTESQQYVQMVDVCLGTDSQDIYRSKQTSHVQDVLNKNKKLKTTSLAIGTDPETEPNLSLKKASVAKKITASSSTNTEFQQQIEVVDASVGTDNDDFYRSKRTTVQVNLPKKKNMKTSNMSTETDFAKISSQLNPKPRVQKTPKIVTEDVQPQLRRKSAAPTPEPRQKSFISKKEPDPIIETLENAFIRFARYGEINSEGREMNNKNWAKLCRDCDFIDNKNVLVGDVDVIFSRHKRKGYRLIDFEMFTNCLNEIADRKLSHKVKDEWTRRTMVYQHVIGKAPELIGITGISKTGNVVRMTDHTLYPVSHKMRFDEEGHGLGIEDKFEIHDTQLGYVMGYKDRDTYDQKVSGSPRQRSGSLTSTTKRISSSSPYLGRPQSSASHRSQASN